MKTAQPIRNNRQARELASYFLGRGEIRNHVLVVIGIHTALRISDLLRLTWDDVYDFERGRIRESITVTEKKTGKSKTILLNKSIVAALGRYLHAAARGRALILSRKGTNRAVSRQQAHRIISEAAKALRFAFGVSCHSLRKTFGYLAWKAGSSPAVIMKIYNHSSFAVTERYLGLTQDDLDDCYRSLAELA
ncbi:MAG: tyrosine-type recombinase/integrase [Clostridiales Family XIII bacterium]|jgi:integrase|nr:tyrosine-type recombinase/integrase [Clostridiales Family XIII bacterium]